MEPMSSSQQPLLNVVLSEMEPVYITLFTGTVTESSSELDGASAHFSVQSSRYWTLFWARWRQCTLHCSQEPLLNTVLSEMQPMYSSQEPLLNVVLSEMEPVYITLFTGAATEHCSERDGANVQFTGAATEWCSERDGASVYYTVHRNRYWTLFWARWSQCTLHCSQEPLLNTVLSEMEPVYIILFTGAATEFCSERDGASVHCSAHRSLYWPLLWATWTQCILSQLISLRFTLILLSNSCLGLTIYLLRPYRFCELKFRMYFSVHLCVLHALSISSSIIFHFNNIWQGMNH
jgi:hypothetical protein